MQTFHNYTLQKIIIILKENLINMQAKEIVEFEVLNPDIGT